MDYHLPVMLNECIEGLNLRPDGTYVDVTYGGGGHSRAIIRLMLLSWLMILLMLLLMPSTIPALR